MVDKSSGDTLGVADGIKFTIAASDNLGLRTLSIALSGGFTLRIDSVFSSAVTTITLPIDIPLPVSTTAGGVIVITATAIDGNNNSSVAVDSVFLVNSQALSVRLIRPGVAAVTSPGKQMLVQVDASQNTGIKKVGYTVTGNVTDADSILLGLPLPDTVSFEDTLLVPAAAAAGTFIISGFAEDSAGRRATSTSVTVTIQSVATDATPPVVTVQVANRGEVRDSINVRATDPSGITLIGWLATDRATGGVVGGDSTTSSGALTDFSQTYNLNFMFASFPQEVIISAFGVDAAGNRGEARADTAASAPIKRDTITIVNGITKALPAGGRVADAIYNSNLNEIYMTNVELDRLEIFQVTDTSFATGIPIGSRPWGIALWPRDINGNNADSVLVANSGGTNISVVDVLARREIRRHRLPNFLVQTVQTEVDPATQLVKIKITEYDFSDRPEYLGAICRPNAGTTCPTAAEVYSVYSTTPTLGQSGDFALHGTVRWENINQALQSSHFFWEHAEVAPSPDSDTLQIIVDRGPGIAQETILSAACGITVTTPELAFLDTTFVRNSGDFTHALVGEGGVGDPAAVFARAIGYQGNAPVTTSTCSATVAGVTFSGPVIRDNGISPSIRVRDFISNTAIEVNAIAINFNGLTNLIRTTDSVYALDEGLRLMGTIGVPGANPGMDINFDHAFDAGVGGTPGTSGGGLSPNDRLVFLARQDANIDVFDTWFYQRVAQVLIRDPVIGPLRVAKLASGEQVLIGVTFRGVVTVRLPAIANVLPSPQWGLFSP